MSGKSKGGKNKRRCKKKNDGGQRELILKEEGQVYAQITKILGCGRMEAKCFDNETRVCVIRGKMNKRNWITIGDVILLSLREYQDKTGDIIGKYTSTEVQSLRQSGEIPDSITINPQAEENMNDNPFIFEDI